MKVVLITPKFHLPIDTRTTPHLGMAYLAAVSERRGDEVFVYDADVEDEPLDTFMLRVKPDLVGITCQHATGEAGVAYSRCHQGGLGRTGGDWRPASFRASGRIGYQEGRRHRSRG